jgi:uncharacterized protein (TIGR03083 family)
MRALTPPREPRSSLVRRDDADTLEDRFERALATLQAVKGADPALGVADTPGWSVGDVFAHLAIESDRYAREVEGDGSWSPTAADIANTNRRELDKFEGRDPQHLLTTIRRNVDRYLAALSERDPDDVGHGFDAGLEIALRHGAGVLLGELVVHGNDLSVAAGRPAAIRAGDASFIVDGAWRVLPAFLDTRRAAGFNGAFEVRLRGYQVLRVRIDEGLATVGVVGARPDVVISADPVAFLLVMYGRRSQFQAVVRLQMVAWGRRPERAFMLRRLFLQP